MPGKIQDGGLRLFSLCLGTLGVLFLLRAGLIFLAGA
jgi:hypothetical protein